MASYRLKGFYGGNKLYVDKPRRITTATEGAHFEYYWFVINDAALTPGSDFQYQVSVGTEGKGDPDLYVSLMDGRWPTEDDFDLISASDGADSIRIERYANSTMWHRRGWDPAYGVVVVVGVRVDQPMTYTVVLTRPPSDATSPLLTMDRITVGDQRRVSLTAEQSAGFSQIYQFFNWYHRSFEITFSLLEGSRNATLMYQKAGQSDTTNSIYTGVPLTINNSLAAYNVTAGGFRVVTIDAGDCYSCWYFIRIDIADTVPTRYQFSIAERSDSGGRFELLKVGETTQVNVRAVWQGKFVLDASDSWVLSAVVASGDAEVFIGLNPDTVDKGGHIWSGSTASGRAIRIAVKTTDSNFHTGTYYFIHIRQTSAASTVIKLALSQERSVGFIGNNHDYTYSLRHPIFLDWTMQQRFRFLTSQEQVKFHVFRVPSAQVAAYHKVEIAIDPLTPNFYPKVYLNKVELQYEPGNTGQLRFPNLVSHDLAFGENPFF